MTTATMIGAARAFDLRALARGLAALRSRLWPVVETAAPSELLASDPLAIAGACIPARAEAREEALRTRQRLDQLRLELGRPLLVWETRQYRAMLLAARVISAAGTAFLLRPVLDSMPLAIAAAALLAVQGIELAHAVGRSMRQFRRAGRTSGIARASAGTSLAMARIAALGTIILLLGAEGSMPGAVAAVILAILAATAAAFFRHDPDPDYEAAHAAAEAAAARLKELEARHAAAVATARAAFEARLAEVEAAALPTS